MPTELPIVKLSRAEIQQGATVGMQRLVSNRDNGRNDSRGSPDDNIWERMCEGALAELALAKHLNLFHSKGVYRGPDLIDSDGNVIECRSSLQPGIPLRVQKDDADDTKVYLVTGCYGLYTVRGWIMAGDGKRIGEWKAPKSSPGRFAYWIDQKDLKQ